METPLEGSPSLIFCPYKAFTAPGGKYGWDVPSSGTFFTYNLGKAILLKGVEKTVGVLAAVICKVQSNSWVVISLAPISSRADREMFGNPFKHLLCGMDFKSLQCFL